MRRQSIAMFLALLAVAPSALASPPSNANSSTPACITLVGAAGVVPATSFGTFEVINRDLANNPVVGAAIVIDLSQCPDLRLCADQLDPDAVVDCVNKSVTKRTDVNGTVHFTLLGGSNGSGNAVTLLGGGKIYANGVLIGSPTASAYDLDGVAGVGVNDLSCWLGDFGSGQNWGRSEFDCNGSVGVNDLSVWLAAYGSGTQVASCASTCP